jgi:FRG domain-containing protein
MDIKHCRNVKEFLKLLDPFGQKWHGCHFRGQSNAVWELYPSIWRPGEKGGISVRNLFKSFRGNCLHTSSVENTSFVIHNEHGYSKKSWELSKKINNSIIENIKHWLLFVRFENYLLSRFYSLANRAGLKIAEEQLILCKDFYPDWWLIDCTVFEDRYFNLYKMMKWYGDYSSVEDYVSFLQIEPIIRFDLSLPQHYGLPTRSLDWTGNALKAAFFAANPNAIKNIENIAVYVIKIKEPPSNFDPDKKWPNLICIKDRHSRYANAFLHAQDGLFTTLLADFYYWENGEWPSIEKIDQIYPDKFFELKKIILPARYSNELLQALSHVNISLSTMMPHYSYVAKEITGY